MKKILTFLFTLLLVVVLVIALKFFGSATNFNEPKKYLYIHTGAASKEAVLISLKDSGFIKSLGLFELAAGKLKVWQRLRPGKYEIANGSSLFTLIRKLRNGSQTPVNLIITKLRTKKDLAALIGRKFESDSSTIIQYLNNNDSLKKFGLDTNTIMTAVFPNTYSLLWNTSPQKIISKLNEQRNKFWTAERKQKAKALGLTPEQDKFAVGDFTLKRILFGHINSTASSPYNTYKNKGIPPGPICTPSETTIDAVLNPKQTDYLFFCAKPNGNGYHAFAATDAEHLKNAKAYQQWLDSLKIQ
ncbi:MAG: endolytic transglycosylase MltG [Chitinophagaceae bacterium]|nr:endolytic transglycosylase MltG [Chitinophagaceae bacterium]